MDELTALRRLEADTPAATEAVMSGALAALTERMDAARQDDRSRPRTRLRAPRGSRWRHVPIWTTAVVASGLAVVAVLAVQSSPGRSGGEIGAPAASPPAAAASPTTAPTTPTPTGSARPDYEFDLADAHDMARAQAEIACYHRHGVEIVGLTAPDRNGIAFIEYGGAHDDQRSIELGLRYQSVCTAAGDAVR